MVDDPLRGRRRAEHRNSVVLAVLFGVLSAVFFGGLAVAVRRAFSGSNEPEIGATVASTVALAVTAALTLFTWPTVHPGQLWPFALTGLLVPGASQLLFVRAVRDAGPSRAAILIGTAPLISVLIALTVLDEPFHAPLVVGALLIVGGGAVLTGERIRPHDFKARGAMLALACACLFAVRDNLVRWVSRDQHPPPLLATTTSLLAAATFLAVYLVLVRRVDLRSRLRTAALPFVPAGLALAAGYICLLEAFSHGRVSIVAPLNATQSLWAVLFAAVVIGHNEAIGPRLVSASLLILTGGMLISVLR
jgi:drug/metabolite transporter (DMT)-like permease